MKYDLWTFLYTARTYINFNGSLSHTFSLINICLNALPFIQSFVNYILWVCVYWFIIEVAHIYLLLLWIMIMNPFFFGYGCGSCLSLVFWLRDIYEYTIINAL